MADKLMYITNDDTQNYPLCRLQYDYIKRYYKPLGPV